MPKVKGQKNKKVYENGVTRLMEMPSRYELGFLDKLDKRTEVYALLKSAFDELTTDLGGSAELSHVKRCLCERFVWLEFVMRKLEYQMSTKNSLKWMAKWTHSVNALLGLAKTLGLNRKVKKIESLSAYVEGKKPVGRPRRKSRAK